MLLLLLFLSSSPLFHIPPSSKERKQKVLGLHHCLHHCDNLHIYLVILSLFCTLLPSISPCLVCAAETPKRSAGTYFKWHQFERSHVFFFSFWEKPGEVEGDRHQKTSPNQVMFFFSPSPRFCDLCAGTVDRLKKKKLNLQRATRWRKLSSQHKGDPRDQTEQSFTFFDTGWG